jgi:hypothetical protein
MEDCESDSEADVYMEDTGHEDDLDYGGLLMKARQVRFPVSRSRIARAFILDFLLLLLNRRVGFQGYLLPFARSLVCRLNGFHKLNESFCHSVFQ